ncbi:phytoene desaturase [Pedobacter sp. MC2016-14]|uniref:phytoene desaturase family protein n=1 Tax=Pedobacter sp. MC2016-14 TaxID=2897327 RepID=UPI001E4B4858|nr:phytoene desaturase family protein [Pedobacter sp. MC2016-14]MCD0489637.1 phytoene desaturase [Pedobacter sp. MC2016-14]
MARVSIIGTGFSGLSAACFAAKAGHDVTVFEKNATIGGRARMYEAEGFKFDMGPSWYWMPDVFEDFFAEFGKKSADYYELIQLDPGFQMIFNPADVVKIPANETELYAAFENIEAGSSVALKKFLKEAEVKYTIGMKKFVFKPSYSWLEYINFDILKGAMSLQMFSSVSSSVRSYFKDERLIALMEFPVLFLGATAGKIPALYTMMNYSALVQGTWYPKGGMHQLITAMETLARSLGVTIYTNTAVSKIEVSGGRATALETSAGRVETDGVIASADYHHVEQHLLEAPYRNYTENYWEAKTFAPSCLIYYLGINKKLKGLLHHNLFFDADLEVHAAEIYTRPKWPEHPLFYTCCPSKTDETVAPEGMENVFILIPIATGLTDTDALRERYFNGVIQRMENYCGESFAENIVYKKTYCINDFVADYNAYKGNAYGLANTLLQTAVLKPSLKNKKVANLFYTGQLTVPGPGVPPALISGQVAAKELIRELTKKSAL